MLLVTLAANALEGKGIIKAGEGVLKAVQNL